MRTPNGGRLHEIRLSEFQYCFALKCSDKYCSVLFCSVHENVFSERKFAIKTQNVNFSDSRHYKAAFLAPPEGTSARFANNKFGLLLRVCGIPTVCFANGHRIHRQRRRRRWWWRYGIHRRRRSTWERWRRCHWHRMWQWLRNRKRMHTTHEYKQTQRQWELRKASHAVCCVRVRWR